MLILQGLDSPILPSFSSFYKKIYILSCVDFPPKVCEVYKQPHIFSKCSNMEKDKGVVVQPPWKVMLILEPYQQYDNSDMVSNKISCFGESLSMLGSDYIIYDLIMKH